MIASTSPFKSSSGGIYYKSKKKSIKVGYLTANDENILIGAAQNANTNVILTLLRNKIYETDLRPEELLNGDVEAIMIYLRNTSFGPELTINVVKVDEIVGNKINRESGDFFTDNMVGVTKEYLKTSVTSYFERSFTEMLGRDVSQNIMVNITYNK